MYKNILGVKNQRGGGLEPFVAKILIALHTRNKITLSCRIWALVSENIQYKHPRLYKNVLVIKNQRGGGSGSFFT